MGFNFGAFAGGLATSIQKQQELNLQEEKYQQEITNAQNKLKQEETKNVLDSSKQVMDTQEKLSKYDEDARKATTIDELNTIITAKNNLANAAARTADNVVNSTQSKAVKDVYSQANYGVSSLYTQMNIKDVNGQDKTVIVPEGYANAKDSITLDANGNIAIKTTGQDGKFDGNVVSTNERPYEFKPDKESFANAIKVIDPNTNQPTMMLPKEYYKLKSEGKEPTLYKEDKGTKIDLKIQQQVDANEKLYDELYNLNESGDINNKKDVHRMKAVSGQLLSTATTEDKKAVGETKQLIGTIPALERIATIQDNLATQLKAKGGDTIVSKAITNIAPYIGSNSKLMELAGMDEATIAKTLQLDTSAAKVIGDYAKAMSGLSLTDSQLQYYKNTVIGGDWMDYKTRALKTKQFIADEKKNIETKLNTYGDLMLPEKKQWESKYGGKQNVQAPYGNEVSKDGKQYIWDSTINKYVPKQ